MFCTSHRTAVTGKPIVHSCVGAASIEIKTNDNPPPSCRICLTDIEPLTDKKEQLPLYCNQQVQPSQVPTPVAHEECVKALYESWRTSDTDMRLPHCPRCQSTLPQEVMLSFVPQADLLRRYKKLNARQRFRGGQNNERRRELDYLGKTIMAGAAGDVQRLGALLLLHKRFNIIATHGNWSDPKLCHTLQEFCRLLSLEDNIKLLIGFYDRVSPTRPNAAALEHELSTALITALSRRDSQGPDKNTFLMLASLLERFSPASPARKKFIDAIIAPLNCTQLADLSLSLHNEAEQAYGVQQPVTGNFLHRVQQPAERLSRGSALALTGLKRKLKVLWKHPTETGFTHIQEVNKLRKHSHPPAQRQVKAAWEQLRKSPLTHKLCIEVLAQKLASSKGLSAKDFNRLEQLLLTAPARLWDNSVTAPMDAEPFAHAAMAYPREGRGMRRQEWVLNPLMVRQHMRLQQSAQQRINAWVEGLRDQLNAHHPVTLSTEQQRALKHLALHAPKPVKQQASFVLQIASKSGLDGAWQSPLAQGTITVIKTYDTVAEC